MRLRAIDHNEMYVVVTVMMDIQLLLKEILYGKTKVYSLICDFNLHLS